MEVGAVKQAFNNEVIQLKRNLNQAKIQTIHKLTRKAKTLTGKKAPDKLKDKLKRKAESAVNEVLILKKVKPKDIAKFAVTHTGELQDYLNKPLVDQDKACARLLLHKSLQEKYKFIRNTFSNIPINDLLMSRNERRKMKKEAQEKQKMKRDKKQKAVNAEGDWEVENIKGKKNKIEQELSGDEDMKSDDETELEGGNEDSDDEKIENDRPSSGEEVEKDNSDDEVEAKLVTGEGSGDESIEDDSHEDSESEKVGKCVKPSPAKNEKKAKNVTPNIPERNVKTLSFDQLGKNKNKLDTKKTPKPKDVHKNKNLKKKLVSRKFKKDASDAKVPETKIVDPFFITSTGENYMSVVEPRQPDEVKEVHKQGNRKLRRAVMFGHVPKIKPRRDDQNNFSRHNGAQGFRNQSKDDGHNNYRGNNSKFNRNDNSQFGRRDDSRFGGRNDNKFKDRNDKHFKGRNDNSNFKDRNDSNFKGRNDKTEPKVEKLHPSWEAKKKKSGILPFQGKKIVFDES